MKKPDTFSGLGDFFVLWTSQAVSSLGTAMTNFALILWVYQQRGTASSITQLTLWAFLPTILFRFIAGAIADSWNKKRIMLFSDTFAAMGTAAVLVLHSASVLDVRHLYVINFLLSLMNAFQSPAAYVATSLLVPKEQYARVSALQSFSGSVINILAPALGGVLFALGGLRLILMLDLAGFAAAFAVLLFFVKIPDISQNKFKARQPFVKSCMEGINYLRGHSAMLRMILFFTAINFLAKLGGDGMLEPFILARTGGDQTALGIVKAAVSLGLIAGSVLVTAMKPVKRKTRAIFISCGLSFLLGDVAQSLTPSLPFWAASAFIAYLPITVLNANLNAIMRSRVPIEMQGRVFSAQSTLQNGTIPVALLLAGPLADYVFEPLMASGSPFAAALTPLVGSSAGSGIALMFLIAGTCGAALSFLSLKNPLYKELDSEGG